MQHALAAAPEVGRYFACAHRLELSGRGRRGCCWRGCWGSPASTASCWSSATPEYLRARIRAGLLEQGTVDLLTEAGVGDRLARERLIHEGVELAFDGRRHRIDLKALSGKVVTIYGQAEIQKDLMDAARGGMGTHVVYEAEDVSLHGLTGDQPRLRYHKGGETPRDRVRFHRRLRRLPRRQPPGHPAGRDPHLRARLSVRLARHPVRHAARQPRADLRQPRARLCAVHHALA